MIYFGGQDGKEPFIPWWCAYSVGSMYSAWGLTEALSRLETRRKDRGKTNGVGVRPRGDLVGSGGNGAGWGRLFDELDEDKDGRVSFADLADAVNPCLSTLAERPQISIPERRTLGRYSNELSKSTPPRE